VKGVSRVSAQGARDRDDVVVFEEADGGDAGCSGGQAGPGVLESDPCARFVSHRSAEALRQPQAFTRLYQPYSSPRKRRTIVAIWFSWKRRMAAMPAAPASRQDRAFCKVIPPSASTGILARQAS
jgi:hypothetical protein